MELMVRVHVVVLTREYHPVVTGGSSVAAADLADALIRQGERVTVVVPHGRQVSVASRGRLRVIRLPGGGARSVPLSLRRYLEGDVLHVHSYRLASLALGIQSVSGAPLVCTCHSLAKYESLVDRRRALANQALIFRHARRIVSPSYWEWRAIRRLYPSSAGRTVVIPNGVHVPHASASGWRTAPQRLLYAGRVVRSKGVDTLIRAVAILKRSHPNVTLTLIGYDTGGQWASLRRLAGQVGVSRSIRWLGGRAHRAVLGEYRRYGMVIMPSRMEAFGLVALEALAQGVPLVSTRRGGLSDFVSDRVAQVIPTVSAAAIASAVRSVWSDRKRTLLRVLAGRQLAARYSHAAVAARYRRLYRSVVRGACPRPQPNTRQEAAAGRVFVER